MTELPEASLEGTTFIKRCGLQRAVKCWKTSRLLEDIEGQASVPIASLCIFLQKLRLKVQTKSIKT